MRRSFGGFAVAGTLFLACGGSVSPIPDAPAGTSSGSISSSTSASSSGGGSTSSSSGATSSGGTSGTSSSGASSGSSGTVCTVETMAGNRACVPGRANAGVPVTIDVAAVGCAPCFGTMQPCKVDVTPGKIRIGITAQVCKPAGDVACPAICQIPQTTCTLPPLEVGRYTVELVDEKPRSGLMPRELVVVSGLQGEPSCTLSQQPPPPLEPGKYATTCTNDADCRVVTVGDICKPCTCPNYAIATTESATFDADLRARASQCTTPDDPFACAPCPPVKPKCVKSGPVGTCKVVQG